ncbi:FAD-binding oxidoreductase [Ramlibacter rhizophilus]|uniref:FAD-binding oxidoreductase n=1 Tax=Ramlibacter rhizophilus TaxID=1781167 RepID=A0A4Z0C0T2_9BURK|nr:FAD-binding oxidoreductase [Ramlibacter rhizophilus]TFZ04821.1 FAD-binding oxidoreductase [Ramlibacter rhizophilus]
MTSALSPDPAALQQRLRGHVLSPGDADYDTRRQVWNAMIDRRPAMIARCAQPDDVPEALRFARDHGLEVCVRGGGHNIAGNAIADGALMIDLSEMRAVAVLAAERRARVQGGATLADVDAATQREGLAVPLGINSTTGVAGLTLGGGFGWLTRGLGMTVDSLVSAQVVTADGRTVRASAEENADLFWGLRGGGGNFGVVTEFEFELHPVGPEIHTALAVYPLEQGAQVLRNWRDYTASAPESVSAWCVTRYAPPLPFLPASAHGRMAVIIAAACVADASESEGLLAPLLRLGEPAGSMTARQPYAQWQQAFDPLLTPGARNYWKSHNFERVRDEVLDAICEFGDRLPADETDIFIGHIGGAPNRVPQDATAYAHRGARYVMNVHGRWRDAATDAAGVAWARGLFKACKPYASSGAYQNFLTADETGRQEEAWGANHERLRQLKQRWDPDNVFHFNVNVLPAA